MSGILRAAQFAAEHHAGQQRKYTGRPYITHPARVAARTMLLPNCTLWMAEAAWLHDVPEDCTKSQEEMDGMIYGQISTQFCLQTAELVSWLTNPSKFVKAPRSERKRIDREHLARAPLEAKQIKLIDRLDNVLEMSDAPEDFLDLYFSETEKLLELIGDAEPSIAKEIRVEMRQAILSHR